MIDRSRTMVFLFLALFICRLSADNPERAWLPTGKSPVRITDSPSLEETRVDRTFCRQQSEAKQERGHHDDRDSTLETIGSRLS